MSTAPIKKTRSELLFTFAGRLVQIAVGLATLKVQTHYLPPEQVGEYGLYLNITTIFVFVMFRPINQYFSRRLHEWFGAGAMPEALRKNIAAQMFLSLASIPIIAASASLFGIESSMSVWAWAAVWGSWYFFNSVFNIAIPALNLLGFKREWLIYNSLGIVLGLAAAWLSALLWKSAFAWTIALTLGFAVSSTIAVVILLRLSPKQAQQAQVRPIAPLSFIVPATLAIGGTWVQFQAFRLFAADFMSLADYGLFTAGYGLAASLMASFEGLVAQYLLPFFYGSLGPETTAEQKARAWSTFLGISMTLTAGTCLVVFVFGKLLCTLLFSSAFAAAWPYFFIGAFIEGIRVVSGSAALGTHITLQVHRSLRSYIFGIVALGAGYAAGKMFGSFAAFTTILVAGCVVHLGALLRDVSRHLAAQIILPGRRPLLALLVIAASYALIIMLDGSWPWTAATMLAASIVFVALLFTLNKTMQQTR